MSNKKSTKSTLSKSFDTQTVYGAIHGVLNYFDIFGYPVSAKQVHTFLPMLATEKHVTELLEEMRQEGKIWSDIAGFGGERVRIYAPQGHIFDANEAEMRHEMTKAILQKNKLFFDLAIFNPWVMLIGISGSCAMDNAKDLDDCDVFIISAPGRIWLARLSLIVIAKLLGTHRSYAHVSGQQAKHKICMNLFFDQNHIELPLDRQSLYTAHELVQMRPIMVRGRVYVDFMESNMWAFHMMPQAFKAMLFQDGIRRDVSHMRKLTDERHPLYIRSVGDVFERIARWIQLKVMHSCSGEYVSDEQLWFFPQDFARLAGKNMP